MTKGPTLAEYNPNCQRLFFISTQLGLSSIRSEHYDEVVAICQVWSCILQIEYKHATNHMENKNPYGLEDYNV